MESKMLSILILSLAIYASVQAPPPRSAKDEAPPTNDAATPPPWYVFANEESPFCYNDSLPCGPSHWGGYCNHGNQERQSPIDLSHVNTRQPGDILNPLYRLRLSSAYSQATFDSFYIQNDGHSIQISLPQDPVADNLRVTYDILGLKPYQFVSLHFHWGRSSEYGAEHLLNSTNHVMEAHLVHYDMKYGSAEDAVTDTSNPEALSVLGIFVEVCAANSSPTPFAQLKQHVENVAAEPSLEMTQVSASFSLTQFLPKSRSHYSYQGSLTTPSCLEIVKWTVFRDRICITQEEIDAFRRILTQSGEPIDVNHRPIQKLGRRRVTFYKS